jgi:hypothetical protein
MTTIDGLVRRLDRITKAAASLIEGCVTCRGWPQNPPVFVRKDASLPEKTQCPDCGRMARKVIIEVVPSSEQLKRPYCWSSERAPLIFVSSTSFQTRRSSL